MLNTDKKFVVDDRTTYESSDCYRHEHSREAYSDFEEAYDQFKFAVRANNEFMYTRNWAVRLEMIKDNEVVVIMEESHEV